MDRQNFMQTGGFPLETDTLHAMQNAYDIFNALGEISGDKTIISGCVQTGQNVSDGVVYLNGEVFKFKGGSVQSYVRIMQNVTSKSFENGDYNEVAYERYVTFSTGTDQILWTDFKRTIPIAEIQKAMVPVGVINMWSGSIANIPKGWVLCDGTNGTPNLKGRFIVGYDPNDTDYNSVGKVAGSKTFKLGVGDLPPHTHSYVSDDYVDRYGAAEEDPNYPRFNFDFDSTNGGSTRHYKTTSTGGGLPVKHLVPYYTLAFIQYKGY